MSNRSSVLFTLAQRPVEPNVWLMLMGTRHCLRPDWAKIVSDPRRIYYIKIRLNGSGLFP